ASGWRIAVSDNGNGVPPEAAARIFEPLFTTKSKGTGLGLAIVATIVRRHNGKVWVEQGKGGKGATFVIEWSEAKEQHAA
ncbi:MAG TPA: HAMP domain-containing sensor histidine kinase, partial [Kofleriaceae bacterium]|nr:HAMP domain-containing sensor histidine kinase [Kofleriaceae bacterium]